MPRESQNIATELGMRMISVNQTTSNENRAGWTTLVWGSQATRHIMGYIHVDQSQAALRRKLVGSLAIGEKT